MLGPKEQAEHPPRYEEDGANWLSFSSDNGSSVSVKSHSQTRNGLGSLSAVQHLYGCSPGCPSPLCFCSRKGENT